MSKKGTSTVIDFPPPKFVSVTVDGKEYNLAFDFNALAEAEKATGLNLMFGLGGVVLSAMDASQLRGVLYASLRTAHPEITLEEVGRIMTAEGLRSVAKFKHAIMETLGVPSKAGEEALKTDAGDSGPE